MSAKSRRRRLKKRTYADGVRGAGKYLRRKIADYSKGKET